MRCWAGNRWWCSVILADDLRLSWADAKSVEKMILRCAKQPGLLWGDPITDSKIPHDPVTLRQLLPSLLRQGQIASGYIEKRPAPLRTNRREIAGRNRTNTPARSVDN